MKDVFANLDDKSLSNKLLSLAATARRIDVALLWHLGELESRSLHLKAGYSSLFYFCQRVLKLSEASAYRRTACARAMRKYPKAAALLESGEISMCSLSAVCSSLNGENSDVILEGIRGLSKSAAESFAISLTGEAKKKSKDVIRVVKRISAPKMLSLSPVAMSSKVTFTKEVSPEITHRIAFDASEGFMKKLKRTREMLSHKISNGGLEDVLSEALDFYLEKKSVVKVKKPGITKSKKHSRYIPRHVKSAVILRDGSRCAYHDSKTGRRCEETKFLDFDHVKPFAFGGRSNDIDNIRLLCRGHNQYLAREIFIKGTPVQTIY